jgi:hypothetical protein
VPQGGARRNRAGGKAWLHAGVTAPAGAQAWFG